MDARGALDERRRSVRQRCVVLPPSNEIKAMRWLTGILRALNHLAFSPCWLTEISVEAASGQPAGRRCALPPRRCLMPAAAK